MVACSQSPTPNPPTGGAPAATEKAAPTPIASNTTSTSPPVLVTPGPGDKGNPGSPVEPGDKPVATDAPPSAPKSAKIELRLPDSVVIGDAIPIELVNVDDHDLMYWHPGATNGCGSFRWETDILDAHQSRYSKDSREQPRFCAAVMIPPRWITIHKGEKISYTISTQDHYYVFPFGAMPGVTKAQGPVPLKPGVYTIQVQGAGLSLSGQVKIKPK